MKQQAITWNNDVEDMVLLYHYEGISNGSVECRSVYLGATVKSLI